MRRLLLILMAASLVIAAAAPAAQARTVWLCKPGLADNPCRASLKTTVVGPDGSTRVENARPARRPKIDCFYVYPTVSGQPGPNATRAKDPEVRFVARAHASRFSQVCRVFAPVYRQLTVGAILDPAGVSEQAAATAYRDVVTAWREYLKRHNRGRGVVLVGHSQGTFILRRLVRTRIDRRPAIRRKLVSALLIGGDVLVRRGSDRGGDFRNVPACRRARQTGCVVAYSAFADPPPPDSLFGRSSGDRFGPPGDVSQMEVLCTNPAVLSGDQRWLRSYFTTREVPGPIGLVDQPPHPEFDTYWAAHPRLYRARCASEGGADWLQVDDAGAPSDTRPRVAQVLGPLWGLHLNDVDLASGNLLAIARRQARAFLRERR